MTDETMTGEDIIKLRKRIAKAVRLCRRPDRMYREMSVEALGKLAVELDLLMDEDWADRTSFHPQPIHVQDTEWI